MKLPFKKKAPRSKAQLVEEVRNNQKVNHQRELLRKMFAVIEKEISINDLGNHMDVLAGIILQGQKKATNEMTVASLNLDLNVKAAPHPELIRAVYDIVKDEKAPDEISALITKFMDHIKYQIKEVAFIDKKVEDLSLEEMLK